MVKILLIQTDVRRARALGNALIEQAFTIRHARSGEEALELLRDELPSMIVTDLVLPRMSGILLAIQLKTSARTRDIPIIATTSFLSEAVAHVTADAGCADCVHESIAPAQLAARVVQLLKGVA